MIRIVGIAGSLRRASLNSALLRAAVEAAPAGTSIETGSIRGIPLYDGDVEAERGIPETVVRLKEQIATADGLLLVTPEYNNSIPGPFKNAIDWLSRPAADIPRVFGGRPVAIMGASPGGFGTLLSQTAWLPVLRTLRMRPCFAAPLYVSAADKAFDASGRLIDDSVRERLAKFIRLFSEFAAPAAPQDRPHQQIREARHISGRCGAGQAGRSGYCEPIPGGMRAPRIRWGARICLPPTMANLAELLRVQPIPPGVLLRGLPGATGREEHLLRQVMALANADVEGARCLLYGVEHGAGGAPAVIGLGDADIARIHAQREACMTAIEPPLELAVVTGDVAGKTVAALMLTSCRNTPYVAGERAPSPLRPGECWLFDAQGMRPATRADLDALYETRRHRRGELVLVGIGENPRCECMELPVPDSAIPPSRAVAVKLRAAVSAKKTATAVMGREDTAMGRLAHARIYGPDVPFRQQGVDTLSRSLQTVEDDYRDADLHYRFEQQAVRLNMSVLNAGPQTLKGTVVEITLPEVSGFMVAPRLYPAPGAAVPDQYYPEVRHEAGCVRVRSALGDLAPERIRPVFTTALRLAVERALVGHKIAIRYALVAENLSSAVCGRLRVKFTR